MKVFKAAAESRGYELWYDRSLKAWALTKEGVQTEYFDTYLLNQIGLYKFYQVFLSE